MITRLPKWTWPAAWGLAAVAGMINVVGLLGFEHQAVTHLTGTTSLLSAAVAGLDARAVFHFAAVIGSFLAGTVLSGFIVQDTALQLGRRYGVALVLESLLLFASVPLLARGSFLGTYTASCACGLQNAMVTTFSGTVIRTTHLSGMFTDLGISLGLALRGRTVDTRRLRLCVIIISGFFCGGVAGAACFHYMAYTTLCIPATVTAVAALAYRFQH